jgi:hypothetical protein
MLKICGGGALTVRRLLLTLAGRHCPFGCSYCFAAFRAYSRPVTFESVERDRSQLEGIDVIYPACDVDLFAYSDAIEILERAALLGCSISVSTKAALTEERVERIASIATRMRAQGHVLKIGSSFSTKRGIHDTEPRTATYDSRMLTLQLLNQYRVTTSIVLKPVRVEIPAREYCEIVRDAERFTRLVLIGEEYLDPDASTNLIAETRIVGWASGQPTWPVKGAADHLRGIADYARSLGLECFFSDLELMDFASRTSLPACVALDA